MTMTMDTLLSSAFSWHHSAEGFDYWSDVHDRLQGETPPMKDLDLAGTYDIQEMGAVQSHLAELTRRIHAEIDWHETAEGVDYWFTVYRKLTRYMD